MQKNNNSIENEDWLVQPNIRNGLIILDSTNSLW